MQSRQGGERLTMGGKTLLDLPEVAVASMNATHAEEMEIIERLLAALAADDAPAVQEAAEDFARHVEEHFSREERLMEQHGFPPYPIHKGEHDYMRAEVAAVCAVVDMAEGRAKLKAFLEQEFLPWLVNHVSTMDMATAHFLAMHGVE